MSILFIGKRFYTNRDAYTEKFGRIYQLPYHWSKEIPTKLWLIDYHNKDKISDTDEDLEIVSTPIFSFLFIMIFLKTIIIHRPKTIVVSGDCYIGLLGYIASKLCSSKFIFDVYDKYDTFSGYKNLGFKNLYQFLLQKADVCFFASKKLKENSEKICKKTMLVLNGVDTNHFYPRDINHSREYFDLDKLHIYVGYFGSMELERGIDDLISAVELLHRENKNIHILLAGKKRDDLNLNHSFIHYLGNLPFNTVPIAMACCNLLALPYRNSQFLDHASSCKIGEYIAMDIPILMTNANSLIHNIHLDSIHKNDLAKHSNHIVLAKSIQLIINSNYEKPKLSYENWKKISKQCLPI